MSCLPGTSTKSIARLLQNQDAKPFLRPLELPLPLKAITLCLEKVPPRAANGIFRDRATGITRP